MASPVVSPDAAAAASPLTSHEVVSFLKLLTSLAADSSTTCIGQVFAQNEEMKATIEKQTAEHTALTRVIANLSQAHDAEIEKSKQASAQTEEAKAKAAELATEIENAKKTIADKDHQLAERDTSITTLQKGLEASKGEVKARDDIIRRLQEQQSKDEQQSKKLIKKSQAIEAELQVKSGQLKEIQDLSCNVVDEPREFVLAEINKVYNQAKNIALKYFSVNVSDEALRVLESIHNSKAVHPIPLPASNSVSAKKARVAAFLSILGYRLVNQIFVPFYLPHDEDPAITNGLDTLGILLSNLSYTDPKREVQLRSLLLAIEPDEQKKIAYNRADHITRDISRLWDGLFSDEEQRQFKTDMSDLCRLAVDSWNTLRPLKNNVEPFVGTLEITEEWWLQAELDGEKREQQVNGKVHTLSSKPSTQSLRSAKGLMLVWPGFLYGCEVLKRGFMLLESQVKQAKEESPQCSRRAQRLTQRAATNPHPLQSHRNSVRMEQLGLMG
ncbi:hypothetical protein GGR50DRAFT_111882 [Xylaria sp. CBS 124048]|nr:hypothetical protein GGR50DRAFT_111882 [Xylaria sp. CBS 124048]